MKTVLVIAGPTASGKSGLALRLAQDKDGTVINADSMQVYRGLPILTAQPAAEDVNAAAHALYGVLDPSDACSAARWRDLAVAEIARAAYPVVVGGTGLYLRALLEGFSPIPAVAQSFRDESTTLQKRLGNPAFHAHLAVHDPATAEKLDPLNTQRLVRAYEVLLATGKGLAEWQKAPRTGPPADLRFVSVTLMPLRDALYTRCDARLDAMIAAGVLDEVRDFADRHPPGVAPLEGALGYRPLLAALRGHIALDEAVFQAKAATRHYAKRQVTWFRHQIAADLVLAEPDPALVLDIYSKLCKIN